LADALAAFEPVWEQLSPKEQARVVRLLVSRVEYDGSGGSVAITFRPSGIKFLAADGIDADEVNR
jgi:site-specific DNA recombinase